MQSPNIAKLTQPTRKGVYERARLFKRTDQARKRPLVWITAQAGAGKTTLIASYLETRKLEALWYQIDQSDSDAASFFYCLGQGVNGPSRKKVRLPPLTPEYHGA